MLRFLKKGGHPVDLEFKTEKYEDLEEGFKGYKSEIYVNGSEFDIMIHKEMYDRAHYAAGFLAAYGERPFGVTDEQWKEMEEERVKILLEKINEYNKK